MLRQPETVERRSVEIANAGVPAGLERGARLRVGERLVHVAERRAAEAHDGDLDARLAQYPPVVRSHALLPRDRRQLRKAARRPPPVRMRQSRFARVRQRSFGVATFAAMLAVLGGEKG